MRFKFNFKTVLLTALILLSIYTTYLYFAYGQKNFDKSLVMLAEQFLRFKISLPISRDLPIGDIADYKYNFYLYFGPFSSIFLMPFVFLFGAKIPQYIIGIFSIITSFIAIYFLSKKFKFSKIDSLWLSLFYVFSTVLFSSSVMNISAYQVEVLASTLLLLSVVAYFTSKRSILVGIFLGLAVLTRFTLALAFVFFLVEFLRKRLTLKQLILIFIPLFLACVMLGLYNQRRFHSFFETGYNYNITRTAYPLSENLKHGTTSVAHVPANLYSFLIMPPSPLNKEKDGFFLKYPYLEANPWGMAIWYTSPLFIFLIYKFRKSKYTLSALLTCAVIAVPLFLYYGVGYVQFGYRYALDFLPFLFLLLLPSLDSKLTKLVILLITIGVLFNLIYADSLFGVYPLLNIR